MSIRRINISSDGYTLCFQQKQMAPLPLPSESDKGAADRSPFLGRKGGIVLLPRSRTPLRDARHFLCRHRMLVSLRRGNHP